jgi:hypothetical protein
LVSANTIQSGRVGAVALDGERQVDRLDVEIDPNGFDGSGGPGRCEKGKAPEHERQGEVDDPQRVVLSSAHQQGSGGQLVSRVKLEGKATEGDARACPEESGKPLCLLPL